jgi:hypothetical protein
MAITFTFVEATTERVRYLCTQDGVISSPPVAADGLAQLPNDGNGVAASPNWARDAALSPQRVIPRAGVDGIGNLPAGLFTQAQLRAFVNSEDPGGVLTNQQFPRTRLVITPRTEPTVRWTCDAIASAASPMGVTNPSVEVSSDVGTPATAYLDIHFRHTYDL